MAHVHVQLRDIISTDHITGQIVAKSNPTNLVLIYSFEEWCQLASFVVDVIPRCAHSLRRVVVV